MAKQNPIMAKSFQDLTEREILALAISLEEEDGRIFGEFAERLRADFPATAAALKSMQAEESGHRRTLIEAYRARFGDHIPYISRTDVKGFVSRKPVWLMRQLSVAQVRREVEMIEGETLRYYQAAVKRTNDAGIRKLLGDLAMAEQEHSALAHDLDQQQTASGEREREDAAQRRSFVLQVIQPGLVGLMDGSVSTLAPLFAAAFATHSSWDAFRVGLAASVGAGISMGFAEALSDDGVLSGRGRPWLRGLVCGLMTMLGGLGHTLPYLIGDFRIATGVAGGVVVVELGVISWIRERFMDTPFLAAAFQIVVGGILVLLAGILIGSS
jgi:erythrin-vacuolar iron transport family protein